MSGARFTCPECGCTSFCACDSCRNRSDLGIIFHGATADGSGLVCPFCGKPSSMDFLEEESMAALTPDDSRGLYQKYVVRHADGSPVPKTAAFTVLRIDAGRYVEECREGAAAFARAVAPKNHRLASDLLKWIEELKVGAPAIEPPSPQQKFHAALDKVRDGEG